MDIFVVQTGGAEFEQLSGYLSCVTRARRAGICKKSTPQDKLNALIAELLILSEITQRTGLPQKKIAFEYGAHGKPYLKNSGLQFSLSHAQGVVCAAFSEGCGTAKTNGGDIGIDIESKYRRASEKLCRRALCEEERMRITSSQDIIRMWVQKEAFLKRLGLGVTCDMRGINTLSLPDTASLEYGDHFIGASGKGALEAVVTPIKLEDLLGRYSI